MAPNWVEVLTDPAGVSTRASRVMADYRVAAALVLQGRLLDYSLQRERDSSLPPLDAAEWPVDQDRALLLAILHHVQGGYGAAIERFRQLLAGQLSPDAVLVSGVLGSMALAETDEHPACLELLEAIHARLRGPHEDFGGGPTPDPVRLAGQLLTGLHIGRRYAERGDWAAAIEATQAVSAVQPVTSKTVRLLRHVARGNLDDYRLRAPSRFHALPKGGRPPAVPEPVQRRLWDSRGALAQLLEDDARIAFTDPLRPTSYMTSEDRTDRHLWAATHHGEVLADFAGSRRGRSDLGRYRLLAAATGGPIRPDGQPESDDFSVLLQAGEHDGLERAARWFLRRGRWRTWPSSWTASEDERGWRSTSGPPWGCCGLPGTSSHLVRHHGSWRRPSRSPVRDQAQSNRSGWSIRHSARSPLSFPLRETPATSTQQHPCWRWRSRVVSPPWRAPYVPRCPPSVGQMSASPPVQRGSGR